MTSQSKKIIGVVAAVVVVGMIIAAVIFFFQTPEGDNIHANAASNAIAPLNTNESTNSMNTNQPAGTISTGNEVTYEGTVFIKGYKTPSESFGILTDEGYEIGFGKYDSMKEQFRPYTGERITVTFSSICRTAQEDCCRTLFAYCGAPSEWESLE